MNPVHPVNHKIRFLKIVNRIAFLSATVGLLAFTFLLWQKSYYLPTPTEPSHGVKSGSMSGVGIGEMIVGMFFLYFLMGYMSLTILVLTAAFAVSIISTTIALISGGAHQSKLAWTSLFTCLNICLLTFLILDHDNLFYWSHFMPLLWLSYVSFGLSAGMLVTSLFAAKKIYGYFGTTEGKIGRLGFLFSAGGFLVGMISFIVFAITNLFWK